MKLTRKTQYAVRAMLYLSLKQEQDRILAKDIADKMNIPKQFLAQVMLSLKRAGYVRAIRGANGGFALAKPPVEISLRDVIETIEGEVCIHDCLFEENICEYLDVCSIREVWQEAQRNMLSVFSKTNFKDLANNFKTKKAAILT